ncbi:MAG: HAD family hydrolase [Actinobacteria bacterium]|nr:HAD family hydrolase [Actinomycetota bacterium]
MITAVLFDFYGTLARAVSWGPTLEELLGRRGLVLDPEAHERWQSDVADGVEHLEASADRERYVAWELDRIGRLLGECGAEPHDLDEVAAEMYAALKAFTVEAYEEVPEVLAELRRRGVMVVVCSNWDWDLDRALAQSGLEQHVDLAVTSAQAGARKPHPRIYEHTLELCRAASNGCPHGPPEPQNLLFVGDTWGPDVQGPLAAGLRPVHVWRPGEPSAQGHPPPLPAGAHRVPDLRGVLDLLDLNPG